MKKVYTWAPIVDPQQEAEDYGMKKLMSNVGGLENLWKGDAQIEFVPPAKSLISDSYQINNAKSGDIIIIYGHGSESNNNLYNYSDAALSKCNAITAKDLPKRLTDDLLTEAFSYYFVFNVCHAGHYKSLDLLTGPSTGSFIEEFRDSARDQGLFVGSSLWGPKGVCYREINMFGWIEYENDKKEKQTYSLTKMVNDGDIHIDGKAHHQRITI